jgi:hypothetical protein
MIVIDLDAGAAVYQGVTNRSPLTSLTRKRRDLVRLPVIFLRGGVQVQLASGSTGKCGVKKPGDYSEEFLASATSWTLEGTGSSAVYYFDLDLNTTEVEALFTSDAVESIAAALEVSWVESSRTTTIPGYISLTIQNDYIAGDEGVPTSGTPAYPLPAAIELKAEKGQPDGYAELDSDGKVPAAQLPDAALTADVTVADQTARFALTTDDVQNGDYVLQSDTSVLYEVTDDDNLDSAAGYTALATVTINQISDAGTAGKASIAAETKADARDASGSLYEITADSIWADFAEGKTHVWTGGDKTLEIVDSEKEGITILNIGSGILDVGDVDYLNGVSVNPASITTFDTTDAGGGMFTFTITSITMIVRDATTSEKGVIELATSEETATGTSEVLAVTPKSLFPAPVAVSAAEIDWATGSVFTKTLDDDTTFTFANAKDGQTIVVRITNTSSNYTVTWPTCKWVGGSQPVQTTGAKSDVWTFIKIGSDIFGAVSQNHS